jgi:hypothetical protein
MREYDYEWIVQERSPDINWATGRVRERASNE